MAVAIAFASLFVDRQEVLSVVAEAMLKAKLPNPGRASFTRALLALMSGNAFGVVSLGDIFTEAGHLVDDGVTCRAFRYRAGGECLPVLVPEPLVMAAPSVKAALALWEGPGAEFLSVSRVRFHLSGERIDGKESSPGQHWARFMDQCV